MKGVFREFAPSLLSGALLPLAFPTYSLTPIAWFALAPLLVRAAGRTPGRAALHFFLSGCFFHLVTLQWLLTNVMWAGGWAVLGQVILSAILAVYWAGFGALWVWMRQRSPVLGGALAFAVFWTTLEALQANLFTGFGWTALGYTQGQNPWVLQLAAIGSVSLLGFILALSNALIALAWLDPEHRGWRTGALVLLLATSHGLGFLLLDEAEVSEKPLRVGLYQSNYSLEFKWDPDYRYELVERAADKSRALHAFEPADLFVWPEALILADIEDPRIAATINGLVQTTGAQLLTGAQRTELGKYYNTAYLIDRTGGAADYYDKVHLAPFGEYVPLSEYFPFVDKIVPTIGDLEAGDALTVFDVDGRNAGPLICFEVLFSPMAESLRAKGADFLVVITNLAWFGRSNAILQELELARMRAVETRLPLIHASNTGVSGVFDPYGRFTPVDIYLSPTGQAFRVPTDAPMQDRIMQRLVGTVKVPEPAPRPIPTLPWLFPWLCGGATVVLLGLTPIVGTPVPSASRNRS